MATKKKPSHAYRLQTMSVPELSRGMVMARLRLNDEGLLHRGRKLKDGPLLNAVVAWYLGRPEAEQDRIAREGLERFEAILDGRDADAATRDAPPTNGVESGHGPGPLARPPEITPKRRAR